MPEHDREFQKRWKEMAERISKEHDPRKRLELTERLIQVLDEKILDEDAKRPQPEHTQHYKKSA